MPHHARCVSSFRLGIKISSGCGKVFPGASLPGRLSLLAGLRPASPGPAVLIRGDDPPDPHERGWGWFCHWRRDGPPDPHDRGWGWFCHWRWDGPRTPTVPGLRCRTRLWLWPVALGRRWLAVGDLPLAGGRTPPGTPRCEGCAVTGHAAPGRELLLSQLGGWSLPLTMGRSPV